MLAYTKEHWGYLTAPGRYPGIDLLRAVAVGLVVLFHFGFLHVGWVGVDLFFVISGFLIGGSVLDQVWNRRFSYRRFYGHRALRILPTYYFVLILAVLLKTHVKPFDGSSLKTIGSGMVFLHTLGPYFFPGFFRLDPSYEVDGAWSLAIEEVFYVIAPAALMLFVWLARRRVIVVIVILSLVVVSGPITRTLMTAGFDPHDANWWYASFVQFHSRYDELAAGVLAACLLRTGFDPRKYLWWFLAGAVTLVWLFLTYLGGKPKFLISPVLITQDTIWLPTLFAIGGLLLVLACHWWPVRWGPVVVLARISYPLYLTHILFAELLAPSLDSGLLGWLGDTFSPPGREIILIGCAIVIAYAVSLLVEYPFLRLYKGSSMRRRRIAPSSG